MLTSKDLKPYQFKAIDHIIKLKKAGLFIDMGLGKTIIALSAVKLLFHKKEIKNVLIIAPLRVAKFTWPDEIKKWKYVNDLTYSLMLGSEKKRIKGYNQDTNIHIINVDNVVWLFSHFKIKWDMVIIDESSLFKSISAKRTKILKKNIHHFNSVVIMTGTPNPKSYEDLYSQIYFLDQGKRLGENKTKYLKTHFNDNSFSSNFAIWEVKKESKEIIKKSISDICLTMKKEDYLELPAVTNSYQYFNLPAKAEKIIKTLSTDYFYQIENEENEINIPQKSVLINKILQVNNGCIYDDDKNSHFIHGEKIKILKEIIDENPDENFLVAYNFKTDLDQLLKLPGVECMGNDPSIIDRWNSGKIKILLCHPMSAGHGLNLQNGGSTIIWFGLTWSLELYLQFNARIHRAGRTIEKPVKIIHIIAKNSIDEQILKNLEQKKMNQDDLLDYLRLKLGEKK